VAPSHLGSETGFLQPPELFIHPTWLVIGPIDRRDDVVGVVGDHDISHDEPPSGAKPLSDPMGQVRLSTTIEMVNHQRRDDQVETAARERLLSR